MWATHAAPRREVGTRPPMRSRLEQKQSARCFGPLEAVRRSSPKLAQGGEGSAGRFSSRRLCFLTGPSFGVECGATQREAPGQRLRASQRSGRCERGVFLAGLKGRPPFIVSLPGTTNPPSDGSARDPLRQGGSWRMAGSGTAWCRPARVASHLPLGGAVVMTSERRPSGATRDERLEQAEALLEPSGVAGRPRETERLALVTSSSARAFPRARPRRSTRRARSFPRRCRRSAWRRASR